VHVVVLYIERERVNGACWRAHYSAASKILSHAEIIGLTVGLSALTEIRVGIQPTVFKQIY
jgi:hypothetical protein